MYLEIWNLSLIDFLIRETSLKMHLIMVINHIHLFSLYNFQVLQYSKSSGPMGFPSADSPTANYVSWISKWSWLNQKLQNPQILRINYDLSYEHLQILVSAGIWGNQTPMNTERQLYLRCSCMQWFLLLVDLISFIWGMD